MTASKRPSARSTALLVSRNTLGLMVVLDTLHGTITSKELLANHVATAPGRDMPSSSTDIACTFAVWMLWVLLDALHCAVTAQQLLALQGTAALRWPLP